MNIHKSKKALKRNGVLLLVYDFLLIFIILVKNKMINISEDVVFSAMISLAGGMMIDLLWIIDSKKENIFGCIGLEKWLFSFFLELL